MVGNMYGYSTYTNIPAQRGGYGFVENKTIEWVPASTVGYTDFISSPSEIEPLKEYGHTPTTSGGPKPKNHYNDYDPNYWVNYENSSPPLSPRKYTRGCSSEESNRVHSGPGYVRTRSISGPNKSWHVTDTPATCHQPKNHYDDYDSNYRVNFENSSPPISPNKYTRGFFSEESNRVRSGPGYVRTGSISDPNKSWQVTDPPATHHPLTRSTNNINEALGLVEEYNYYSPGADPRRRGVLDDLPTFSQPHEPQNAYENYASVPILKSGRIHAHLYPAFVPKQQSGRGYHGFVPKPNGSHYNFATRYTNPQRVDPWQRGVLDDMDSNEAYTLYKSPPEPRRLKWTKGDGWWKTKT